MKAIVLAGGFGTRLASVIGDIPKPMARVGSRPFLQYVLDYLRDQMVESVVLAVSYKWQVIQEYFDLEYRGMELHYSVEDQPLGTGGAIRKALGLITDSDVIVVNGDTLFRVDLGRLMAAHRRGGAQLTIVLKKMDESGRFGSVRVTSDGEITSFEEKRSARAGWINGGTYVLDRALFERFPVPERFSFERDFIEPNVRRIRPCAFFSDADFIDIGVPDDYARAQHEIGLES